LAKAWPPESRSDNDFVLLPKEIFPEYLNYISSFISVSDFKQQLLTRLSIDNEEQIFDRLHEIQQMNTDLKGIYSRIPFI